MSFESVRSYSTAGGNDISWLLGSAGAVEPSLVVSHDGRIVAGFDLSAHGFANTKVLGMGGNDVARLQDLATQDAVFGAGSNAYLTRGTRNVRVEDFDHIIAMQLSAMAPSIDIRAVDYLFERLSG
jgi:hypothetical protein